MEIKTFNIDGKDYKMFVNLVLFPNTENEMVVNVAEEKLNSVIEKKIEQGQYHKVRSIDEMYGYWLPQEIADDGIEEEIRDSIESVAREDL